MPTLANLNGASLVPNVGTQVRQGSQALAGLQATQMNAEKLRQLQAQQESESGYQELLNEYLGAGSPAQTPEQAQQQALAAQAPEMLARPAPLTGEPPRRSQQQVMAELVARYPERFDGVLKGMGIVSDRQKSEAADFAFRLRNTPFSEREPLIAEREQRLLQEGRSPADTLSLRNLPEEQQNQALDVVQMLAIPSDERVKIAQGTDARPIQFGAQQTFKDSAGNLYFGTQKRNPSSGEVETAVSAIGNAPSQPVGSLEIAGGQFGLTAAEDIRQSAAKAAATQKAEKEIDIKLDPQIKTAVATAAGAVEAELKEGETAKSNAQVLRTYDAAMKGLLDSLSGTDTGPFVGRFPAVTESQQIADGSIAAMAPVLKSIFRGSGEGTFTDKDQELLLEMVPTRKDTAGARKAKLENIDAIIRAKLNQPEETSGFKILSVD